MTASIQYLDSDGATVITAENLGQLFAGLEQTPKKWGFISTSTRDLLALIIAIGQVGTNDGAGQMRTALDSNSVTPTLSTPYGFSASVGGASGSFAGAGTYGYKISATVSGRETNGSPEITAIVDLITRRVTLTWTQTPGATGYRLYRTPTPGTYGASTLLAVIGSGATTSYNDDGAATSSGTPALTNTTGGWLPTASLSAPAAGGVWLGTGLQYYRVVAYTADATELANSLEVSINVDNVTKKVTVSWPAVAEADSFKLFRSTVSGSYPSPSLRTTLVSGSTSFVDDGSATTTGALTTSPSYGIPPTASFFTAADKSAPTPFQPTREMFLWMQPDIPAGTPEVGNPRQCTLDVTES